jgi:hypothetical protein
MIRVEIGAANLMIRADLSSQKVEARQAAFYVEQHRIF